MKKKKRKILALRKHRHSTETRKPLVGVAQLVGASSCKQKVAGLIPSQSTCRGCGFSPGWGALYEKHLIDVSVSHQCFCPSLSLPPFPLSKIKKAKEKKHVVLHGLTVKSIYIVIIMLKMTFELNKLIIVITLL